MKTNEMQTTEIVHEYNNLAEKLGHPTVKRFADRETAIKRLDGLREKVNVVEKPREKEVVRVKKEVRPMPKVLEARTPIFLKKSLFSTIKKLVAEPDKKLRPKRWDDYKDGMTVYHLIATKGLCEDYVKIWVKAGLMQLVEPTEEFYQEELAKIKAEKK